MIENILNLISFKFLNNNLLFISSIIILLISKWIFRWITNRYSEILCSINYKVRILDFIMIILIIEFIRYRYYHPIVLKLIIFNLDILGPKTITLLIELLIINAALFIRWLLSTIAKLLRLTKLYFKINYEIRIMDLIVYLIIIESIKYFYFNSAVPVVAEEVKKEVVTEQIQKSWYMFWK